MGTIQRQGFINTVIIYIGVALGFLNTIVIQPHFLKTEEVGLARIMISFGGLLSTFLLLGASNTCIRFFPAFRNKETGHHGFLGFFLLIPLTGILVGGIVIYLAQHWITSRYVVESPLFANYFKWAFPLGAVMTLSIAMNAYSNSHLKTTVPSFLNDIWVRVLLIIFTLLYSFGIISLDWFVGTMLITYLSQLLFIVGYIFIIDKPSFKVDWAFVKRTGANSIIKYSLLMALTALSSLSLKFLDTVMIGAYLPLKFVGVYSIGAFIAQFIETPLYSLERIAGVKIAHSFEISNMEEIRRIYYRSVRYLFLVGGFLVVCIITNIHDFLRLLPHDYRDAAGVTIIMSVGSIINMATGVNSPIISNSSKYKWSLIFLLVLLVATVALNMWLIPLLGIEGSAIATGLASVLFNLLKFLFIWKKFGMQPYDFKTVKTLIVIGAALVAGLFLPAPSNPFVAIGIRGSVIAFIYLTLTFLFSIVPEYHQVIKERFFGRKH